MLAFINMNSSTGITVVMAASPIEHPSVLPKTTITLLNKIATDCMGIVGWNIVSQLSSLVKKVPHLANLPMVDMSTQFKQIDNKTGGGNTVTDARDVCKQYFAITNCSILPSPEQWKVINLSVCQYNIKCSAVAGSGKTTTTMMCAAKSPKLRFLSLTFNKRLQLDVAMRVKNSGLANIIIKTYHSAAGEAYETIINTDEILKSYVSLYPTHPQQFDVLLIDEAQDMIIEYYMFVRNLLHANPMARIVVVGDVLQSINTYRGSNSAFLSEAPAIYGQVGGSEWRSAELNISYRLTPATAKFVNTHLYNANIIVGGNTTSPNLAPMYVSTVNKALYVRELHRVAKFAVGKFGINNVCILVPSTRGITSGGKSPIAEFVKTPPDGIPLYIASDDIKTEHTNTKDKLAILSLNSVKGCEWQCIVVQMDETYFEYYNREWTVSNQLPNILSVAATRAISQLIIMAGSRATLRTIKYDSLSLTADVIGKYPNRPKVIAPSERRKFSVSTASVTRHLHPATVIAIAPYMTVSAVPDSKIRQCLSRIPPVQFEYNGVTISEDVIQIYHSMGIAIAECKLTGKTTFCIGLDSPIIHKTVASAREGAKVDPDGFHLTRAEYKSYPIEFWTNIREALDTNIGSRTSAQWAALAVMHNAFMQGRHHIARQITNYNWVNPVILNNITDFIINTASSYGACRFFEPITPVTVNNISIFGKFSVCVDTKDAKAADNSVTTAIDFKIGEITEEHCIAMACALAISGGGNGIIISITSQATREVAVRGNHCQAFLNMLTDRKIREVQDIMEIIRHVNMVAIDTDSEEFGNDVDYDNVNSYDNEDGGYSIH